MTPKWMRWTGRVIMTFVALMMVMSAVMKLVRAEPVVTGFPKLGYPEGLILGIGIAELVSVLLYLFPRTAVLGAILLTGYLGGAIATHVRLGEGFAGPAIFGVLAWLGLFFTDSRVRALIPWRQPVGFGAPTSRESQLP